MDNPKRAVTWTYDFDGNHNGAKEGMLFLVEGMDWSIYGDLDVGVRRLGRSST